MQNDRRITITIGSSRKATQWNAQQMLWSELVSKLATPMRGTETLEEYLKLSKPKQDSLKDAGGFVAGTLEGKQRKASAVVGRDVVTLDMDNIAPGGTQEVLQRIDGLNCAYCVYSTRKHSEAAPRLRVLIPLSRTCTADEYEPIARKLAEFVGMEQCDQTTFEASRLMYWPSCCADSTYVYTYSDKYFADTDGILGMYADWRDVKQWPGLTAPKIPRGAKQADPTEKPGVVGAFCRIYDVYKVIAEILPDKYIVCDTGDRFTYAGGTTTGGAVVYEGGKFLFSHHAHDPAGGKLCNAFDLMRLHLFGDKDSDAKPDTPTNKLPSYTAACEYAVKDAGVAQLMLQERYAIATAAFGTAVPADNADWMQLLQMHPESGKPMKTTDNVLIILEHDPNLKGKFVFEEFSNRILCMGVLPWNNSPEIRDWTDNDDAGLRHYIEKVYGVTGKDRISDAMSLCCHRNKINAVQDYLRGLPAWDGTPRVETLFIEYLGAADCVYTRAVARTSLTAAVARAMQPGVKYDYMPVLAGPQGLGKSTLLRLLAPKWFNDSLTTFDGKDAYETIQGSWIMELAELVYDTIPVQLDSKAMKAYKQMEKEMLLEIDETTIDAGSAAALSNKLLQLCNGAVYDEKRRAVEIHTCKLEAFSELLEQLHGAPALVFYNFQHDMARIINLLAKSGLRVRVLQNAKDAADWNARRIDILLAHPASCAYGLNLQQGGNHVIWFGLNWSLELYQQANKRLHRQGQTATVFVHQLAVTGTRDEDVLAALQDKNATQDALIDSLKARIRKVKEESK